jgi:hypothetical protein
MTFRIIGTSRVTVNGPAPMLDIASDVDRTGTRTGTPRPPAINISPRSCAIRELWRVTEIDRTNERDQTMGQRRIVERAMSDVDLAWALALIAKPYLNATDHAEVFVTIGAGEAYEAIRGLVAFMAVKHIPVESAVLHECGEWLRGYSGHEDEAALRRHIERLHMFKLMRCRGETGGAVQRRCKASLSKNATRDVVEFGCDSEEALRAQRGAALDWALETASPTS